MANQSGNTAQCNATSLDGQTEEQSVVYREPVEKECPGDKQNKFYEWGTKKLVQM